MAKAVVIGATGHVGTYLVPRLVSAGHHVVAVSRGKSRPYSENAAWRRVEQLTMDRERMEREGGFGDAIAALDADIVIDMICFEPESAAQLVSALQGRVGHFLHVGTIWTHGHPVAVPTREDAPKAPFGDYGTAKAGIEKLLLDAARRDSFPVTILHPGHIVGPGWMPLNPAGNFNPQVFTKIARGERIALPNFGLETLHHVHADDIARQFMAAIAHRRDAVGESFHAVSGQALTLRGYAEAMFGWFGHKPDIEYLPFDDWAATQDKADAESTWEHIARSPNCSMEKAHRLLGFTPAYTSLEAVQQSVSWLLDAGQIAAP